MLQRVAPSVFDDGTVPYGADACIASSIIEARGGDAGEAVLGHQFAHGGAQFPLAFLHGGEAFFHGFQHGVTETAQGVGGHGGVVGMAAG